MYPTLPLGLSITILKFKIFIVIYSYLYTYNNTPEILIWFNNYSYSNLFNLDWIYLLDNRMYLSHSQY